MCVCGVLCVFWGMGVVGNESVRSPRGGQKKQLLQTLEASEKSVSEAWSVFL